MKQTIPLPKSSASITYEQLGYLESFDAVVDKLYALLIYKETRTNNDKWVIRIKSSVTAGSAFDPDNRSLENAIRKAQAHNTAYVVWGFNLEPNENDPRLVENRLFFNDNGDPIKIEVHLITRDPGGNALPEKVESVNWPGIDGSENDEGDGEFNAFYAQYEQACRTKDRDFLKAILPADIPEDEVEFVLNMSQQATLALDGSGIKPAFTQNGNRMDVIYNGDLGDGMTSLSIDFYKHGGQWLKYDAG